MTSYVYSAYAASWTLQLDGGSFYDDDDPAFWCEYPIRLMWGEQWDDIGIGGSTAGKAGVPLIRLPGGGRYYPASSNVTDLAGNLIYAPDQAGVRITDIAVAGGTVTLTLESVGGIIFAKESLDEDGWTYLATASRESGKMTSVGVAEGWRCFTARSPK